MNITTIALALNVAIGFTVWQSNLSLTAKIILTVLLVVKFALFFYTAWMTPSDTVGKVGAVLVSILNIGIGIYTLIQGASFVTVTVAVTLLAFILWACATIFCIGVKPDKGE